MESLKELFCTVSGGRLETNNSGKQSRDGVSAVENLRKPLAQMMSKMCSLALSVSEVILILFGLVVPHCFLLRCHIFYSKPLSTLLYAYGGRRVHSGAAAVASYRRQGAVLAASPLELLLAAPTGFGKMTA